MIEQAGRVIAREGAYVSVELGATTGCAACDAGRGCGAGVFGRLLNPKPSRIRLLNAIDAPVGMTVLVGIPEAAYLKLLLRLYLLPLIAGLVGAAIGLNVSIQAGTDRLMQDVITLALAVLCGGLALAFIPARQGRLADHLGIELLPAST